MAVHPVIMPKLGAYTEDVLLSEWLVAEGDEVAPGRAVLELETEKTTAEVEAETSGWLHQLMPGGRGGSDRNYRRGDRRDARGVRGAGRGTARAPARCSSRRPTRAATRSSATSATGGRRPWHRSPAPGRMSGPRCPHRAPPGRAVQAPPLVSPRARALLRQLGFTLEDAREISGSGPGGRIVDRDVAAWAEAHRVEAAAGRGGDADRGRARSRCEAVAGRSRTAWSRASRKARS